MYDKSYYESETWSKYMWVWNRRDISKTKGIVSEMWSTEQEGIISAHINKSPKWKWCYTRNISREVMWQENIKYLSPTKVCSGARVQKSKSGEQQKLYYEASGNIGKEMYGSGLEASGNGVRTQFWQWHPVRLDTRGHQIQWWKVSFGWFLVWG